MLAGMTEHHHGYISAKDDYLKRLRRIEGQARGLQRMVEEEKYCIDILTQVSAVTKALQAVSLSLLDEHLSHCVASVSEEIAEIDGVESVDVVLETGAVTVTSTTPLDRAAVEAAVDEAGYALT